MYVDYIVSVYFAPTVMDNSITDIVNGKFDDKDDAWFAGEDVFGKSGRNFILEAVGDTSHRQGQPLLTHIMLAVSSGNILTQKSSLVLCSFIKAAVRDDSTGAAAETMRISPAEILKIEEQRKSLITGFRRRMESGLFRDSDEIITQVYQQISQSGSGVVQSGLQVKQNPFSCLTLSQSEMNRIMRLNFGSSSLDMLYNRDTNTFRTKQELCDTMQSKLSTMSNNILVGGAQLRRRVVFLLEFGLTILRGFYWKSRDMVSRHTGDNDTGPYLVAFAAAYKFANPFSSMYRLALKELKTIVAHPSILQGIPLALFAIWVLYGANLGGFSTAVAAGVTTPPKMQTPSSRTDPAITVPKFADDTKAQLRAQMQLQYDAQRAVDENVNAATEGFTREQWAEKRAKLPSDFELVCSSLDDVMTTADFMQLFYQNQTYWSYVADKVDRFFLYIPQRFFSALQPSLTLDDVFDSQGKQRKPAQICVAVYLRMESEHSAIFKDIMRSFLSALY